MTTPRESGLVPLRPTPRHDGPARLVAASYKASPEDFVVDELPLYEPVGEGEHVWLRIEKRGRPTMAVAGDLARAIGVRERDIGVAGLKDAQAVTTQWLSLPNLDEARLAAELDIPGVRVLDVTRHRNKLRMGHLRGNRFRIVLRGCDDDAARALRANLEHLAQRGAPNWFGEQRFGKFGDNVAKGLRILTGNPRRAARRTPRRLLGLLVGAVQSEVFNRVLAARIDTFDRLVDGDVAWLHANGACFAVADARRERTRLDRFEISPSGPLAGPKCMAPTGEPGAIEARVLAELDVPVEAFGAIPGNTNAGARRPLRTPVREIDVADVEPGAVAVTFTLTKGSYATSVLRELLADAPWFGGEPPAGSAAPAEAVESD